MGGSGTRTRLSRAIGTLWVTCAVAVTFSCASCHEEEDLPPLVRNEGVVSRAAAREGHAVATAPAARPSLSFSPQPEKEARAPGAGPTAAIAPCPHGPGCVPPKGATPRAAGPQAAAPRAGLHPDAGAPATAAPRSNPGDAGAAATPAPSARRDDDSERRDEGNPRDQGGRITRVARFVNTGGVALKGRVVDAASGYPLGGVIIEARIANQLAEVRTSATGEFQMDGVPADRQVTLWAVLDSYVSERLRLATSAEPLHDTGTIRLLRKDGRPTTGNGSVGLDVERRGGKVVVTSIIPWQAADKAGIAVGDVLLSVDARPIGNLGSRAVAYLLRGAAATRTVIEVEDAGGGRRKVELTRGSP